MRLKKKKRKEKNEKKSQSTTNQWNRERREVEKFWNLWKILSLIVFSSGCRSRNKRWVSWNETWKSWKRWGDRSPNFSARTVTRSKLRSVSRYSINFAWNSIKLSRRTKDVEFKKNRYWQGASNEKNNFWLKNDYVSFCYLKVKSS